MEEVLTFPAVITSEIKGTLTVELASKVNACCWWRTRVFFTIYNVLITIFTYKEHQITFIIYVMNVFSSILHKHS